MDNDRSREELVDADALRSPATALLPDPRFTNSGEPNSDSYRKKSLEERAALLSICCLTDSVLLDIRIHFETARNLFLYAWFVYRFHPIAEQQALTTLEFALRRRLGEKAKRPGRPGQPDRHMTLAPLLKLALADGLVSNLAFRNRHQWALRLAEERFFQEVVRDMEASGREVSLADYSKIVPTEADLSFDWLSKYVEDLPEIRNEYAHGSSRLVPSILRTFAIVSDLTNQLFPDESS